MCRILSRLRISKGDGLRGSFYKVGLLATGVIAAAGLITGRKSVSFAMVPFILLDADGRPREGGDAHRDLLEALRRERERVAEALSALGLAERQRSGPEQEAEDRQCPKTP